MTFPVTNIGLWPVHCPATIKVAQLEPRPEKKT